MKLKEVKYLKIAVVVLILLNIGLMGSLWMNNKPKNDKGFSPTERLIEDVGFSEKQGKEFIQLKEEHGERAKAIKKQLIETRKKYFELIGTMQIEEQEILLNEIANHQKREIEALFIHFNDVYAICTEEEQKQRLKRFLTRSIPGMNGPKHGNRPPRGPMHEGRNNEHGGPPPPH